MHVGFDALVRACAFLNLDSQRALEKVAFADMTFVSGVAVGEGAAGCITKAKYRAVTVAVKATRVSSIDVDALRREVTIYDRIGRHENIVTVFGVCDDAPDGCLRLVMELCELGSLDSWQLNQINRDPSTGTFTVCVMLST